MEILSLEKLIKGIQYIYEYYPHMLDLEELGNMDSMDCSSIIQASIFNEIVFG